MGDEQRDALRDEVTRSGRDDRASTQRHDARRTNDAPPTTRHQRAEPQDAPTPRANAMMTNQARERHETLHEKARRDEEREARGHQRTMGKKLYPAPFRLARRSFYFLYVVPSVRFAMRLVLRFCCASCFAFRSSSRHCVSSVRFDFRFCLAYRSACRFSDCPLVAVSIRHRFVLLSACRAMPNDPDEMRRETR